MNDATQAKDCRHNVGHRVEARIAFLEDSGGFMAELKIFCSVCDKPFQFLGLEPGLDLQGARVSIDGLEANIAITPEGVRPNPFQRISYNINKFNG
jgi:hypothetical protein